MKKNTGFTLIELLVVIAIIGILSSVVLASLNTARAKGADAAVKSDLNNTRAQAELFYDSQTPTPSYGTGATGVCTATGGISAGVAAAWLATGTTFVQANACVSSGTAWAASAPTKSATGFWCVDSTGFSGPRTTTLTTSACPAS